MAAVCVWRTGEMFLTGETDVRVVNPVECHFVHPKSHMI